MPAPPQFMWIASVDSVSKRPSAYLPVSAAVSAPLAASVSTSLAASVCLAASVSLAASAALALVASTSLAASAATALDLQFSQPLHASPALHLSQGSSHSSDELSAFLERHQPPPPPAVLLVGLTEDPVVASWNRSLEQPIAKLAPKTNAVKVVSCFFIVIS